METIANMAVLARALDFPIAVRPPKANREWITRLLDVGVWNLHCPQVETAQQAAEIVAATYYAPLGLRGDGRPQSRQRLRHRGHRAGAPGLRQQAGVRHRDVGDRRRLRSSRRDRRDGRHRRADARTGGPGAGPGRVRQARARAKCWTRSATSSSRRAKKHGKHCSMLVSSYEQAQQWKEAGVLLLAYSSDVQMLLDGFKKNVSDDQKREELTSKLDLRNQSDRRKRIMQGISENTGRGSGRSGDDAERTTPRRPRTR